MLFNGQKASLWQDAVGQHTNWHTCTEEPWKPSRLAGGNMSQPIIRFPSRVLLYLASSCEEPFQGSGQPHKQKASSSQGNNQLKLPQKRGRSRQERNARSGFCAPVALFCPLLYTFLCVPEVVARWMLSAFSFNHF